MYVTYVTHNVCSLVHSMLSCAKKNSEKQWKRFRYFHFVIFWYPGLCIFFLCCCLFWIVVLYYMYGITHVVLCKKKSKIQKNNANVFHRFYFHIVIFWNAMPVYVKKTYRKDACFAIINASASMSAYVIHKKNKISSATANVFRFIHLLYYYFYM